MLTTTLFGFKKPQTSDSSTSLRTAIGDNADIVESLLGRQGYAEVLTSQSTTLAGPADLATVGPEVTVTVPAQAIVQVYAEVNVNMGGVVEHGKVSLIMDTVNLGVILDVNGGSGITQYTVPGATGTATRILSGWLTIPNLLAGPHIFSLRYGTTNGASGAFSSRQLTVRVGTY